MEIDDLHNFYRVAVKGIDENLLEDVDAWYHHIMNLPVPLQAVYTILVLHAQVFNGGFHQYFFNGYGLFAYETIDHLQRIGAVKTQEMLNEALIKVNNAAYPRDEFRHKIFFKEIASLVSSDDELEDQLDEIDNRYYLFEENVHQLLIDYLEKEKFLI